MRWQSAPRENDHVAGLQVIDPLAIPLRKQIDDLRPLLPSNAARLLDLNTEIPQHANNQPTAIHTNALNSPAKVKRRPNVLPNKPNNLLSYHAVTPKNAKTHTVGKI